MTSEKRLASWSLHWNFSSAVQASESSSNPTCNKQGGKQVHETVALNEVEEREPVRHCSRRAEFWHSTNVSTAPLCTERLIRRATFGNLSERELGKSIFLANQVTWAKTIGHLASAVEPSQNSALRSPLSALRSPLSALRCIARRCTFLSSFAASMHQRD
jgi:hypothetical protein